METNGGDGMKTAIVYYSMGGNTQSVAEEIAKRTGADLIRLEPVKAFPDKGFKKFFWGGKSSVMKERPELSPYEFDAEKYDEVVIGTPVWAGSFTPPIRSFVAANAPALRDKRLAVFVCFSGGGAEKAIEKLKKFIGIERFAAELILVDPKDRPSKGNAEATADFCAKL